MKLAAQIRELCTHAWLYNSTSQIDVSDCIDGDDLVKLDLSHDPPMLIHEDRAQAAKDGSGVKFTDATDAELQSILKWLQDNPPHPESMTPLQIEALFTAEELDAIDTHARRISRQLYLATSEVPWEKIAGGIEQLRVGGLLTSERASQILKGVPIGN